MRYCVSGIRRDWKESVYWDFVRAYEAGNLFHLKKVEMKGDLMFGFG